MPHRLVMSHSSAFVWNPQNWTKARRFRTLRSYAVYASTSTIPDKCLVEGRVSRQRVPGIALRWNTAVASAIFSAAMVRPRCNQRSRSGHRVERVHAAAPDVLGSYVCCASVFSGMQRQASSISARSAVEAASTAAAREFAINNAGEVTGTSMTADGVHHAFLWDRRLKMRDLNALIAPDDPLIGFVTLERRCRN